jgi:Tfp pilus assembly protein PilP
MKLTTGVVTLAMMVGTGFAQNPNIINNTKNTMQGVQQQQTAASNQALGISAKPAAAPAKPAASTPAPKTAAAAPAKSAAAKPAVAPTKIAAAKSAAPKAAAPAPKPVAVAGSASAPEKEKAEAASSNDSQSSDAEDKKYSMTGKRDPFLSPVVSRNNGSGCSTGKKCLDIEAIAVRGVVRSDAGMIAVVTNGLNKAYFLRENDPVFNGYVVKITGDSVVFKETFQDKLGKPFTKDVVKKLTTPAV